MDLDAVERLASGEGWGLLQSLPPYDESSVLALGDGLRAAGFDAELVAAALTQSRLRARAHDKFGEFAVGMMFTPDGLEQATRLEVAVRHAHRFRSAGVRHVWDLGCGIGADAMALAGLDLRVTAVDADPVAAAIAGINLRHWSTASTVVGRAEEVSLPQGEGARHAGAWLDPARRTPGVADIAGHTRRVFTLDAISPSWITVQRIAAALPAVGAKLSPSFPHAAVPAGSEAQWTSYRGEVVECAIWWGALVQRTGRSAIVLRPGASATVVTQDDADVRRLPPPPAAALDRLGQWLYEPDKAITRAGLTGALVAAVEGVELDPGVGYVASDRSKDLGFARRFRISEAMPFNVKGLRAWMRDRHIGRVTIKKRGVSIDSDQLRRQLRLTGDADVTIVLTRIANRQVVLVVQPA